MRRVILVTMVAVAIGTSGPGRADLKTGIDAWNRGDDKAAVEEWRGPAAAGDPDAQFRLGRAYQLGRGVPIDRAMAERWFHKAALQGHREAGDGYGLALYQDHDLTDALPWLETSAARGEPHAQQVLGTMLFDGNGIGQDYPRAYALMTRASAQGLAAATETLAQMDQYLSAADREKGSMLARRYASKAGTLPPPPIDAAPVATLPAMKQTDLPPSRIVPLPVAAPVPAPPIRPALAPLPARPASVAPAMATPARPTRAEAKHGAWRVQLGAFRDRANADALWARVRGRMAGAEPAYVRTGDMTRLLATGFASRADAQRACAAIGTPCMVVAP